ncbi:unnamed protein product, partial [Strongylus vulgaris]
MATITGYSWRTSSREQLPSRFTERTNFLRDLVGERRHSHHYVSPFTSHKPESTAKNRVAQLVARLEKIPSHKKPPLAVPEIVEPLDEAKKSKRKYVRHLTSTRLLSSIFRRDEEKKKFDFSLSGPKVVAITGGAVRDPIVLRERQFGDLLDSELLKGSKTGLEPPVIHILKKRRSEGAIIPVTDAII